MKSILLQAFEGKNKTVPVWFMRQAGRFLPQYRKLKEKHSLKELFQTTELAAEITCLPINILKVDAAILFADLLTLPMAMGFEVEYKDGQSPLIKNPIKKESDLKKIHDAENLDYLAEIIQLTNQKLPKNIPLIGFAGSPFSVLYYLLEEDIISFMVKEPQAFGGAMKLLTKNTIDYLNLQKNAGIKAFQIFDTWAGILRPSDYAHFVLPCVKEIFEKVDLPSIYYLKNCAHLLSLMDHSGADFLSVCHTVVLGHNPILKNTKKGIQGNLFNGLLYADKKLLEKEVKDVLLGARHYPKYIFNLSHGIFPDVEVEKVKLVVDEVHAFPWK